MPARPGSAARVAVLVPDPDFAEEWAWAYDIEAAALAAAGLAVEPVPWTRCDEPGDYDLVMPLVAWGYHLDHPRWLALLDRLERERAPVLNPVPLLRWNSDKAYLAELGAAGVATVETMAVEALDDAALGRARERFGCEQLVIKPPISASADGTFLLAPGEPPPAAARGRRMLVQPFLPAIASDGEYSLMFFGGEYSHAIIKRPRSGDFRVQPHLGGTDAPCPPPTGGIALARAALAAAPAAAAYARVDMLAGDDGEMRIMELELVEPALWLQHAPGGGGAFASAVMRALEQPLADR
ncbi:MAG TPA: hypothetical protein VM055_03125 [Novosphingobium sp.]|nr:hypothetical protein [Novosphingobium sp.]